MVQVEDPSPSAPQAGPDSTSRVPAPAYDPSRPLLTIAIPTWNRADMVAELLSHLVPQIQALPPGEVDLLVCDNGSDDDTVAVLDRFARQIPLRHHREPVNLGSDANFITAFRLARGTYFWLFSDDDIPVPGALEDLLSHLREAEYDLVYATSYGFHSDWAAERKHDSFGRRFHVIPSASRMTLVTNVMFTFISGMIVNKARFEALRRSDPTIEAPSAFHGTNLIQLSWILPLLRRHRQSLVLWDRPVAGRHGNSGGYSVGRVFGENLTAVTARCLPDRPDLRNIITDVTLRRWFPANLMAIRTSGNQTFSIHEAEAILRRTFGSNPRFWIFTWPILKLPLPLGRIWLAAGAAVSRLIYMLRIPTFWRRQIGRAPRRSYGAIDAPRQ